MSPNTTRRTLLGSIATMSVAGLAGCSSGSNPDQDTTKNTSHPSEFETVETNGTELVVTLADRETVETLQMNYDGEKVATEDVENADTGTFDIGVSYTPGVHTILAIKEDDVVAETSIELAPELEIVDLGLGKNHPEKFPEGEWPAYRMFFEIENTGNAADQAIQFISKDTPQTYTQENEISGFYNFEPTDDPRPIIKPDSTITIYTRRVFGGTGTDPEWECGQSHSMEFGIAFKNRDTLEKTIEFESQLQTSEHDTFDTPPEVQDDMCNTTEITTSN